MLFCFLHKAIGAYYRLLSSSNKPEEWPELQEKFKNVFTYLEKELEKRQTLFFNGQTLPGMLDYMIWPWMERLEVPTTLNPNLKNVLGVPISDFPLMVNKYIISKIDIYLKRPDL